MGKNRNFRFSVIIPIYNVEKYLREALDSVISQTLSFNDNIQLVLINDGSPDNSDSVCIEYRDRYPDNIVYVKQKNGGVSSARNRGLELATGEYVGFLDPDDKVSLDCYSKVNDFIKKNQNTHVFSYSIHFFGSVTGPHAVNDKFNDGSRVVDINDSSSLFIQSNVASVFIKRDSIGDVRFDTNLKYGEDGKFINTILLKSPRLGLVSDAVYFYRKRGDGTSAVDGMTNDKSWYFDLVERYLIYIAKKSLKEEGGVTKYVQNVILHDLRWRFQQAVIRPGVLDDSQKEKYFILIKKALSYVDDDSIANFNYIRRDLRVYMLQFKHGLEDPNYINSQTDSRLDVGGYDVSFAYEKRSVFLDIVDYYDGTIVLEGWYEGVCNAKRELQVVYGKNIHKVNISIRNTDPLMSLGLVSRYKQSFCIKIKRADALGEAISFRFVSEDLTEDIPIIFGYHTRLTSLVNHSYRKIDDLLFSSDFSKGFSSVLVREDSWFKRVKLEASVSLRILLKRDFLSFGARIIGWIIRSIFGLFGKEIWVFIDRPLSATDNAYAMFEYVKKEDKSSKIFPVFVLAKESSDRARVGRVGFVVDFGASLHKIFLFASKKVLSAHFDGFSFNPYAHRSVHMRIGLRFDLIYLQHGVLAADLSGLLNKYSRNIRLITASSESEKMSIINNKDYRYGDNNVVVAGQARFDELIKDYNKNSKIILLAPTWRLDLTSSPKNINGRVLPGRNSKNIRFKDTDYYKFYSKLLSSSLLTEKLRSEGYKIRFCLHPQIAEQRDDFEESDVVEVLSTYSYDYVLRDAVAMITDYSGVAFDFAYTKRPILYTQYDADVFYKGHTYTSGYFSFKKDGFGSVVHGVDDAVAELIKMIDSKFSYDKIYDKRVDKFFKYIDSNNRSRIYEAVSAIDKHR